MSAAYSRGGFEREAGLRAATGGFPPRAGSRENAAHGRRREGRLLFRAAFSRALRAQRAGRRPKPAPIKAQSKNERSGRRISTRAACERKKKIKNRC